MRFTRAALALVLVLASAASVFAVATLRADNAPRMRALIIAISAYDRARGYAPLNAANDVPRIRGALELHGFDSTAIQLIADQQATRAGILAALRQLVNESQPGDVVVIHYSGHGDRLTDDNTDELDGLDELLVPVDAPYDTAGIRTGSYRGQLHIRDDELAPLLESLRAKVYSPTQPGSVTLFIDACFSGTVTRGEYELPARGAPVPLGPPASNTRGGGGSDQGSGAGELVAGRNESNLAPMVVLSATRQDQLARETRDVDAKRTPLGAFSLALSRVLARSNAGVTYRAVMHQVAAEIDAMGYSQRPQLEGDLDAVLFSGRSVPQKPYHTIRDVRGDTLVRIRAGSVVGVLEGAQISFFPVGTRNPDSAGVPAIARGLVRRASETVSDVIVPAGSDTAKVRNSWAFVTRASMGDVRVRVKIERNVTAPQRAAIAKAVSSIGLVQLVDSLPDLVIGNDAQARAAGPVIRAAQTNALIASGLPAAPAALTGEIEDRITTYARGRFLKERVQMKDPRIDVRLDLVPVKHIYNANDECEKSEPLPAGARTSRGGEWELRADDGFVLRVKNTGRDAAYVTILYIMPNGKIFQLFPNREHSQESNYLEPGRDHQISLCYTPDTTPGAHTIKMFATREPVNFEPVLSRGGTRSPSDNPLEQLLGDALGARDPGTAAPARGTGTTSSLLLHIVSGQ